MSISVGQTTAVTNSLSSNNAVSFGSLPASASCILGIGERYGATTGSPSMTDNQTGNSYTLEFSQIGVNDLLVALACLSITSPSGTFTGTLHLAANSNFAMVEIDGVTSWDSAVAATTGGTVSSSFAASITAAGSTSAANSIVVAYMGMDSFGVSPGWSTPSGWTNISINTTNRLARLDYIVLSSQQTVTANWGSSLTGQGSSGSWGAVIVAFDAPAGSAVPLAWIT